MPFEPGKPKTGGRSKGVVNKKTQDLLARLDGMGFDPIDKAIEIIRGKGLDAAEKVNACLRLAEFFYPKKKAVEVSNDNAKDVQQVDKVYVSEWGSRKEVSDAKEE